MSQDERIDFRNPGRRKKKKRKAREARDELEETQEVMHQLSTLHGEDSRAAERLLIRKTQELKVMNAVKTYVTRCWKPCISEDMSPLKKGEEFYVSHKEALCLRGCVLSHMAMYDTIRVNEVFGKFSDVKTDDVPLPGFEQS